MILPFLRIIFSSIYSLMVVGILTMYIKHTETSGHKPLCPAACADPVGAHICDVSLSFMNSQLAGY